jgi:lambda family phage portal protein
VSRDLLQEIRAGLRPTWLDRKITQIAPTWGLKRMEARATMAIASGGAWAGGRRENIDNKNWKPITPSPDDEQRWDRDYLLSRATDLERNDALAGGAIEERVLSVVGTGLSVQPSPLYKVLGWSQDQAVDWAQERKERFNLWAQDPRECDIARRRNFYQGQVIAYRTAASRGDCFTLLQHRKHSGATWALKFQIIEGDRCLNPPGMNESLTDTKLSQGIEVDDAGGAVKYWFCKRHPALGIVLTKDDFIPVDAWGQDGQRLVLPLMHENRLDLRRGYPMLAPVIAPLKQMSRLSDSELAASVVSSFFAVVIKKSGTGSSPLAGSVKKGPTGKSFTELGHALVAELNPGEEIQNVNPTRPNGAFDPFWKSLMGQIAMRLQIPPEILLKKFESSYTAARGALLQFWKFVTVERENFLAPDFCQPLYEAWLAEDVATGRTKAPGFFRDPLLRAAYCNARWIGDNPPILDPLKEVLAAGELIDRTLSTRADQTMRLTGGDFEENVPQLAREVKRLGEGGLLPATKPGTDPKGQATVDPNAVEPMDQPNPAPPAPTPAAAPQGRASFRSALIAAVLKESL